LDTTKLLELRARWGPSARTCLRLLAADAEEVDEWESTVAEAAAEVAKDPSALLANLKSLRMDSLSHKIFFIRPKSQVLRGSPVLFFPTRHILDLIAKAVARVDQAQQVQFFQQLSSHPSCRSSAGWLYEKLVQARLTVDADLGPLPCIPQKSSNGGLQIPVAHSVPFGGISALREVHREQLPATFWPTYQTFPLADAIAFTANEILLIQITVSPRHSFKLAELQKLKDEIPATFQQKKRWCMVYVAPDEVTATALRNRPHHLANPKDSLDVFSSVFVPGDAQLSEAHLQEILVGPCNYLFGCTVLLYGSDS
jgi:hypothetical protein